MAEIPTFCATRLRFNQYSKLCANRASETVIDKVVRKQLAESFHRLFDLIQEEEKKERERDDHNRLFDIYNDLCANIARESAVDRMTRGVLRKHFHDIFSALYTISKTSRNLKL